MSIIYSFEALNFNGICKTIAISLCPLIGQADGIEPVCYSRNVELSGNIIFQPSTLIIDVVAIIMTMIMIYHIRSKYTAVVTAIIPTSSAVYPWFAAIHIGLICATYWCLLLNGFVGFQFAEDGTPLSLWSIRISSFVWFLIAGFLAIGTFKGVAGLSYDNQAGLWIFYIVLNYFMFFVYVVSQIILVVNTLDDRWPLGDILFAAGFFTIGQVLMYVFSVFICDNTKHYVDGLFFGAICNLLTVMMVYKYWDSITKEDLEFSVGSKQNVWEVKELLGEDEISQNYTTYQQPTTPQHYQPYEQHPF
ncbi:chitin synthase III catalytic subunit [Helicostylum pulchrum]|nr:chitin synthase III catalytic subunit [Helicostylum pulchrum]